MVRLKDCGEVESRLSENICPAVKVPAGFRSPAEDYLDTPIDLTEYLIQNKTTTFTMLVDGVSMKDAGILNGNLLVADRAAKPVVGRVVVVAVMARTGSSGCAVGRTASGSIQPTPATSMPISRQAVATCSYRLSVQ